MAGAFRSEWKSVFFTFRAGFRPARLPSPSNYCVQQKGRWLPPHFPNSRTLLCPCSLSPPLPFFDTNGRLGVDRRIFWSLWSGRKDLPPPHRCKPSFCLSSGSETQEAMLRFLYPVSFSVPPPPPPFPNGRKEIFMFRVWGFCSIPSGPWDFLGSKLAG